MKRVGIWIAFLLVLPALTYAATAQFTNDQDLFFTGSSSAPGTLYQDAIDGNLDVGIQLCDSGQRFVGGFYAAAVGGTFTNVLVTNNAFDTALAFTNVDDGGGCFSMAGGFLTVSPSQLTTPNPDVQKAAFPGRLYIGHAGSGNPGSVTDFVFGGSNAQLLGSYSVTRSFDQSTRNVAISTPSITFQTSSSSFSKSASDSDFGVASDRQMVIATCSDSDGGACAAAQVVSSSGSFPLSQTTGLTAGEVSDQQINTRYVVINGLGNVMCIGANLQTTGVTASPDPIFYSQTLNISFSVSNPRNAPFETSGGNVEVSTDFSVNLSITNSSGARVFSQRSNITTNLAPNAATNLIVQWPAFERSGIYTVTVTADDQGVITECAEGDNSDSDTFELKTNNNFQPFLLMARTLRRFQYQNVPYNVTFHLENSDGDVLRNATINLTQVNGVNLFAPTQIFNRTTNAANATVQDGVNQRTIVTLLTDYFGNVSLTLIPTYNRLYLAQFNYLDLDDYVGNYSLYFDGEQVDGENFIFITNGTLGTQFIFTIDNLSSTGPFTDKSIVHETIVSQMVDFVYNTFTNFIDVVVR